ncbi:MAG: bifunctional hydroxymethylpyrimidine kinase/phosphomethylpyrimidine kinase [Deltaproteobacteria bacterium]|nr:bifunctional hydroxymethylpyrimidine kinase/phosphomethylpyrimidine kinase [Deltaproteobacteria bacterium]
MIKKKYHRVLTIAGSDSGGGAGIQADLKTFSALGCYGMSVITALTAQNTIGVSAIHAVPPDFVEKQMEAVFSDLGTDAVKIGMLYSAELVEAVAGQLKKYKPGNIVLDPVMVSQSKDKLTRDRCITDAIKEHLIPLTTVFTPNLPEASMLLNRSIDKLEDMYQAARDFSLYGTESVLIKGGHLDADESDDLLFITSENRHIAIKAGRINTRNDHGTGCTLSSAIASFLARGDSIEKAVRNAKKYISGAISAGSEYQIGYGHGPVHHFYKFWQADKAP